MWKFGYLLKIGRQSILDRGDGLDLDGNIARQGAYTDRRAEMPTGIAEYIDESIRAAT